MKPKILYIMSSYNLYGGTPKKTLDLMKYFGEQSVLFVYEDKYSEFKSTFEEKGRKVYEGFYGNNYLKYIKHLLEIIDNEKITIVQTQFFKGEILGVLIKLLRPNVNLIICFVGALPSSKFKTNIEKLLFKKADQFVFVSNYVKTEKKKQFSFLKESNTKVVYNGTEKRLDSGKNFMNKKGITLLSVSGLISIKNVQILIEAMRFIVTQYKKHDLYLYIAGDGPMRKELEELIKVLHLEEYVFLLGYQDNIGGLLDNCDIYLHPCYKEGFGIAAAEAMLAEKPIIVANAGALPELIENEISGLVVAPHDAEQWANAILRVVDDPELASKMAFKGKERAINKFSKEKYTKNYENLYNTLIAK